jgi:hypothetical protein
MLEHDRDAVLNWIVAAATGAMKPNVRAAAGAGGERLMAHRANQKLQQCRGKGRRHAMILDPFTMNVAGRMGHGESSGRHGHRGRDQGRGEG